METKSYANAMQMNNKKSKNKKILEKAWEVRNYEIDKYWSRTLYFVGFLSAILIAYTSLKSSNNTYIAVCNVSPCKAISGIDTNKYLYILLTGLGTFISFIWYLVNRGSKFWQENWENHIDCLEKELQVPPLYGTILFGKYSFFTHPLKAYPISPSRANILISLVIFICFLGVFLNEIFKLNWDTISFYMCIKQSEYNCTRVIFFIIIIYLLFKISQWLTTFCLKKRIKFADEKTYIHCRNNNREKTFELDEK